MNTNTTMGYDLLRSPSSEVLRRSSLLLLLLLFSCTALLLPLSPSASARASDDADRLALLIFKSGVSYDPYGWLDSWSNNNSNSSSLHHCRWSGVTCSNSSSRVTTLDLGSMGLEGVVIIDGPRGSLSHLQELFLGRNYFHGVIPSGIGWQLPSLTFLDLSFNLFEGSIPPSLLLLGGSNLSSLQRLDLSYNNLTQLPEPSDLGLQQLSSSSSSFSLVFLDLSNNKLVGSVPPYLFDRRFHALELLDLSYNSLSGAIPLQISNLVNLSYLDLSHNNLGGGIPPSLGSNLTLLSELSLSNNMLTGTIPDSFGGSHLMLSSPSYLSVLDFSANSLQGPIPPSLTNLSSLTILDLSSNKLQGPLPPGLGRLKRLRVSENRLQGSIPESLGSCRNLNSLDLSGNHLSGGIPPSMGSNLTLLSELRLSNNMLTGTIPDSFGSSHLTSSSYLSVLDLSANSLQGRIPPSLTNLSSLTVLDLSSNKLHGPLPPGLGRLKRLEFLQVSENRLQGSIPESLGSCRNLYSLNLSFNHLEGPVPTEGIFDSATAVSVYGNDKLCGGVPELHLPACQPLLNDKKKNKWPVIISVSLFGVLFLIMLFGFLTIRRLRRYSKARLSVSPSMDPVHPKVSYIELLKATNDFSYDNLMGFGNCGSVYMGTMNDGEAVAVKVFNLENRGVLKSFMSECEALRNIRHRNLVKILTACSTTDFRGNDFKALVYEFMPNGSLEGWLHSESDGKIYAKRLNLTQRVNIAIDVAAALDYLHNQCIPTIVHCDLKPSNVLLDANMTAHVGDFGLSKFLPMAMVATNAIKGAHFSNSVHIRGSIGYIPPEYGMGGSVSTHGDVFSYGMLLLELFTGIRPTDGLVLKDGLTLQKHVEVQLSKGFSYEIAYPSLILNEDGENIAGGEMGGQYIAVVKQCLLSLFAIALSCVKESPRDRIKIEYVVSQMHQIREGLLVGTR